MLHKVLQRILKRFNADDKTPITSPEDWKNFLQRIHNAYNSAEQERYLLERSLRISSKEMQERWEEKNQLTKHLAKSEAQFRAMNDASPLGVFMIDGSQECIYCNKTFTGLTGLEDSQMFQDGWVKNFQTYDGESIYDKENIYNNNLNGQAEKEVRIKHSSGSIRWLSLKMAKIADDNKSLGFIVVAEDISKRKLAESLLMAQSTLFEKVSQNASIHETLEELALKIESEHQELICSFLLLDEEHKHLVTGAAPSLPQEYNDAINGICIGENVGSCGTAAYTGRQIIVSDIENDPLWSDYKEVAEKFGLKACWSTPIFGDDKDILGTSAIYLKTVGSPDERQLKVMNQMGHLAAIAIERKRQQESIEKERVKSISASKMATLGEMASGIAHEINNPLAIISGSSQRLLAFAKQGTFDIERMKTHATKIHKTTIRISKIIKGLQFLARDGTNDPYEFKYVYSIVEDAIEVSYNRYKSSNIELKVEENFKEVQIQCQAVQISQVLINLLSNAYDAVVELEEKWVRISLDVDDDFVYINVIDSGKGIPKHIVEKIMHPFYSTKGPNKGTGLGLSISRNIILSHNGDFYVDENSENTCFVIKLPLKHLDTSAA